MIFAVLWRHYTLLLLLLLLATPDSCAAAIDIIFHCLLLSAIFGFRAARHAAAFFRWPAIMPLRRFDFRQALPVFITLFAADIFRCVDADAAA